MAISRCPTASFGRISAWSRMPGLVVPDLPETDEERRILDDAASLNLVGFFVKVAKRILRFWWQRRSAVTAAGGSEVGRLACSGDPAPALRPARSDRAPGQPAGAVHRPTRRTAH